MRLYTVAQARALLPRVIPVLEQLRDSFVALRALQTEIEADQTLASGNGHLKAEALPAGKRGANKENRLEALNRSLRQAARQLADWDIELKDPERGLIDFQHEREGEVVYLCYELGEPDINYWHRIEDGYAGRQPID